MREAQSRSKIACDNCGATDWYLIRSTLNCTTGKTVNECDRCGAKEIIPMDKGEKWAKAARSRLGDKYTVVAPNNKKSIAGGIFENVK